MAEYATAIGFVQFDVDERDVSGQTVRDVTIRTPGADGKLVRVTVWPEFSDTAIEKGDFVAVDGVFEARTVGDKTYLNMSAKSLLVQKSASKADPEVANKPKKGKSF